MKSLSIIIPAYNAEPFLDKAVSSLLTPEILNRIEIIVVNDGSVDRTAEIAQKYCDRYPDTVRLISQENKGHGGALNTGCAAAEGKYLKILDADDWFETQNLSAFVDALEQLDSDVVLTPFHTVEISNGEVLKWAAYPEEFGKALTFREIMSDWRSFYRCFTFHGITYKTVFYQNYGSALLEHVFYEDYEYTTFPCCYAASVTPLDILIYDYRIGDVNQSVSEASRLKRISHLEAVLGRMIEKSRLTTDVCAGANAYVITKTQELLLSYFTTVLLIDPDKRAGRINANKMLKHFRNEMPEVAAMVEKKYQVFNLMNRLHISKAAWDAILKSPVYGWLRHNHSFE